MFRFRIVCSKKDDATVVGSYETPEKAVENCPPGRAVRDAETGQHVDPEALMDEKKIRWF